MTRVENVNHTAGAVVAREEDADRVDAYLGSLRTL